MNFCRRSPDRQEPEGDTRAVRRCPNREASRDTVPATGQV